MLSYLKAAATAFMLTALVACNQSGQAPDATVTLQQIQDTIKTTCNYAPTIESLAAVAATIASGIEPAAGATATVAVAVGNSLVTEICKAVQTQSGKMSGKKGAEPQTMDVVVNGVVIHGTLVENKT